MAVKSVKDEVIELVKHYYGVWKKMSELGGAVTQPLSKLLEMEKEVASALAKPLPDGLPELKYCDKEFRELYFAASIQRKHLLELKKKNAGYWIAFSGAALGEAVSRSEMIRKSDSAYRKLREARRNLDELKQISYAAMSVLEALKIRELVQVAQDLKNMAPDLVRTYSNRLAGKRVDDALHAIVNYIDPLYADLDRAIEIVEDLNSEIQRYYKDHYSKFNFAELLKMYVEDWKKENAQKQAAAKE